MRTIHLRSSSAATVKRTLTTNGITATKTITSFAVKRALLRSTKQSFSGTTKTRIMTTTMRDKLEEFILDLDVALYEKQIHFKQPDEDVWYSRESCKYITLDEVLQEILDEIRLLDQTLEDTEDMFYTIWRMEDE